MSKIKFSTKQLDRLGLVGPAGGKRSLAYEFCVLNSMEIRKVIFNIDASIKFSSSPGRIACSGNKLLCLGETNKHFKKVFAKLVKLEYVESIEQTFFE